MPPVGQKRTWGKGPCRALSILMPPTASAGKSLTVSKPYSSASMSSPAPETPGMTGMSAAAAAWAKGVLMPGLMANIAPASVTALSWAALMTVPAPTTAAGTSRLMRRMASTAAGVRKVISSTRMLPSSSACANPTAVCGSSMAMTGTTGPAVRISRGVISVSLSVGAGGGCVFRRPAVCRGMFRCRPRLCRMCLFRFAKVR